MSRSTLQLTSCSLFSKSQCKKISTERKRQLTSFQSAVNNFAVK